MGRRLSTGELRNAGDALVVFLAFMVAPAGGTDAGAVAASVPPITVDEPTPLA